MHKKYKIVKTLLAAVILQQITFAGYSPLLQAKTESLTQITEKMTTDNKNEENLNLATKEEEKEVEINKRDLISNEKVNPELMHGEIKEIGMFAKPIFYSAGSEESSTLHIPTQNLYKVYAFTSLQDGTQFEINGQVEDCDDKMLTTGSLLGQTFDDAYPGRLYDLTSYFNENEENIISTTFATKDLQFTLSEHANMTIIVLNKNTTSVQNYFHLQVNTAFVGAPGYESSKAIVNRSLGKIQNKNNKMSLITAYGGLEETNERITTQVLVDGETLDTLIGQGGQSNYENCLGFVCTDGQRDAQSPGQQIMSRDYTVNRNAELRFQSNYVGTFWEAYTGVFYEPVLLESFTASTTDTYYRKGGDVEYVFEIDGTENDQDVSATLQTFANDKRFSDAKVKDINITNGTFVSKDNATIETLQSGMDITVNAGKVTTINVKIELPRAMDNSTPLVNIAELHVAASTLPAYEMSPTSTTLTPVIEEITAQDFSLGVQKVDKLTEKDIYTYANVTGSDTFGAVITPTIVTNEIQPVAGAYDIIFETPDGTQRTITVTVIGEPQFILATDVVNVKLHEQKVDVLDGVEAYDALGKKLVPIVTSNGSIDVTKRGEHIVTYEVTDSYGNTLQTQRVYIVGGPEFKTTETIINLQLNEKIDVLKDIEAFDSTGLSLIPVVISTGGLDETTRGKYIVTYEATDRFGNSVQFERTYIVGGAAFAPIEEVVSVPLYAKNVNLLDGVEGFDAAGEKIVPTILSDGNFDVAVRGQYFVTYEVADRFGNIAQVQRTFIVGGEQGQTHVIFAENFDVALDEINVGSPEEMTRQFIEKSQARVEKIGDTTAISNIMSVTATTEFKNERDVYNLELTTDAEFALYKDIKVAVGYEAPIVVDPDTQEAMIADSIILTPDAANVIDEGTIMELSKANVWNEDTSETVAITKVHADVKPLVGIYEVIIETEKGTTFSFDATVDTDFALYANDVKEGFKPKISGTVKPNNIAAVRLPSGAVIETIADADGKWEMISTEKLENKSELSIVEKDIFTNSSQPINVVVHSYFIMVEDFSVTATDYKQWIANNEVAEKLIAYAKPSAVHSQTEEVHQNPVFFAEVLENVRFENLPQSYEVHVYLVDKEDDTTSTIFAKARMTLTDTPITSQHSDVGTESSKTLPTAGEKVVEKYAVAGVFFILSACIIFLRTKYEALTRK